MARTEYKTIAVGKMEKWFVSHHTISHKAAVASLSDRWSVIRPHPIRRRKGRMCIVSPFDDKKGGCASSLRSTALRQHVPICGTRRSL